MAEIIPFKAVHYGNNLSNQLDRLITPPYDVISADQQEAFYQANPYNIIRLVLGKQTADDNDEHNRYTRAAATLEKWLNEKVLVGDDESSFTIYQMEFEHPEKGKATLDGIVGLIKVDDYGKGKVLPHEKTYKGPKADQLSLMKACKANLTPIHGLYDDEPGDIINIYSRFMKDPPDQEAVDEDGNVHRTWRIKDEEAISRIRELLAPKSIFIADGHHRYETALAYKNEIESTGKAEPGDNHDYVMMYVTAMTHPGLTILPAHRMVKGLSDLNITKLERALDPYFYINELSLNGDINAVYKTLLDRIRSYSGIGGKFGMIVHGASSCKLLRLKDFDSVIDMMDKDIPSELKSLDVTILREIIMRYGLGMDVENSEGLIEYTPLFSDAVSRALKGTVQVSFVLNPTRVDQMRAAAELGHKLPHKSTYFFPKLSSGMVMNILVQ